MLRILIVDDEPPARKRLRQLVTSMEEEEVVEIAGEASDGIEALDLILAEDIDLILLDVQMPGLNGFDLLDRIPPENRPAVIFTTAYDSYAIRAFEENAVDYLLKPVSEKRLQESIERVGRILQRPEDRLGNEERLTRLLEWMDNDAVNTLPRNSQSFLKRISLPHREKMVVIPVSSIVTVEVQDGITRLYEIHTDKPDQPRQLTRHVVSYTLDQLEANLNPDEFMRVHRSAIVRLDHIREIVPWFSGRCKLILSGSHEVIASRTRSKELKAKLSP